MAKANLYKVGLTGRFEQEATMYEGLHLARVSVQHKNLYKVVTENSEIQAEVSGKIDFSARDSSDYPVVGDWVMVDRIDDSGGNAIIHRILRRQSAFERKAAGTSNQTQVVAANIDTVFICMSLNNNFNLRRLERYLAIAWDSMATPVVILTKSDLCDDISARLSEAHSVAPGVDVLVTTSMGDEGYAAVNRYLGQGKTAAFIGSSGVGKSTLINRLMGEEILVTYETGDDDKGRHTTTHRQLIALPNGGVVIDTPGMRELQLENADLSKSFADIEDLANYCRFNDCKHQNEPGCAVKTAIEKGILSAERLGSYQKLQTELSYQGLNSRQLEHEKINRMFGGTGGMKQARSFFKEKNRQR
ncbi:putative ribosome biogenesis GTPase RsgA [Pelotomaculum schinkii]|uniref:Small ribosomal subunit biogenesis GTPase RsgA n=1 Tax=Pelotomaculum schinkii TaxID=78350 RepID=A0A4Y7R5Q5_9FIRM|nr:MULTISPECIES: ribosome small subunit-dependent GTPase A [Pelotomaculum]TEB04187.1 putative ribosome biogenesis GTPase RsgA [Pelotomaculum schinkii]TEB17787.1 putative ribosome biogenesis GTPase RsgA [Pelotomaculum sp. FP]